MSNLKIVALKAENVKGLKAVEIHPDDHFQVVSGPNGAGKSSIMDSIWLALAGRAAIDRTEQPVRNGADQAIIEVDLGELRAIRRFKPDGSTTIEVRSKEGAKLNSPQKVLDALIGKLSFDPFAFANLKPDEQRKTLMDIVGVDPKPFDDRRSKTFDDRTIVNREVEILKGQLVGLVDYRSDGEPEVEESAAAIMQELRAAQDVKKRNDEKRMDLKDLYKKHADHTAEIKRLEELIASLTEKLTVEREALQGCLDRGVSLRADVDSLVDPDFEAIQTRLESIEDTNAKIRKRNEYRTIAAKLKAKQTDSDSLTNQIASIDAEKADALSKAKFPISGLGFGANGVTYAKPGEDPVPFEDVNDGDRLKVSVAMAMALNPQLRVIRIKEGSLLDKKNMAILQEMAREQDYQVWVEQVADDASGAVGIYIEDGEVRAVEKV